MKVEPADLQLRVAAIVIEALVARGTACFQQIRRQYLNAEEEDGKQVIRIKGNVVRKTLPGRAADYEPINVVIYQEEEVIFFFYFSCCNLNLFQVKAILRLLSHLPRIGCNKCSYADPPMRLAVDKDCVCDDLFLQPLTEDQLQRSKGFWFRRQRRGRDWFLKVLSQISKKAGLSKVYTNSCMRPTVVTDLMKQGYDTRQIMEFTGHKSAVMVQNYSRRLERMKPEEKKTASALLTSSGRNKLRGAAGAGNNPEQV